jgi:hypothetical protein
VDATRVEILLPGQPTDAELESLYLQGVLKYEVYCEYLASKHGFQNDAFYPKPQIDIMDLNGVKEDDGTLLGPKKYRLASICIKYFTCKSVSCCYSVYITEFSAAI